MWMKRSFPPKNRGLGRYVTPAVIHDSLVVSRSSWRDILTTIISWWVHEPLLYVRNLWICTDWCILFVARIRSANYFNRVSNILVLLTHIHLILRFHTHICSTVHIFWSMSVTCIFHWLIFTYGLVFIYCFYIGGNASSWYRWYTRCVNYFTFVSFLSPISNFTVRRF
jgi:hypothetical protein